MSLQQGTRLIAAGVPRVRQALLDPRALPEWNPGFRSVGGPAQAVVGTAYPIRVRGGVNGTWEYTTIEDVRIYTTWEIPGFHELGAWTFEPRGDETFVTHELRHRGPLERLLRKAYAGVAESRLDRLTERVAGAPA